MIGTNIRSVRHLYRIISKSTGTKSMFMITSGSSVTMCDVSFHNDTILILNDSHGNRSDRCCSIDLPSDIISKYRYYLTINKDMLNYTFNDILPNTSLILLPDTFDSDYNSFLEANKKMIIPISRKYAGTNDSLMKFIYTICDGSKNFFQWAVTQIYGNYTEIPLVRQILKWNESYSQLSKELKKGTITAYTSKDDIIYLRREIMALRQKKRANDVINQFNTTQKKLLKELNKDQSIINILGKFGKLSNVKKNNFIRKMSTVNDVNEILKQMSFLVDVHFKWNKESLLEYIKNTDSINCEIVKDDGNIVLVKVFDYDTVKRLAKSTNWCISKNKKYWNEYVGFDRKATQYVIFDFSKKEDDKLSIVGFTSKYNIGISNAHNFTNDNLMTDTNSHDSVKSFMDKYNNNNGIFSILKADNIDVDDVTLYDKLMFNWNRASFFKYLNECTGNKSYEILSDNGDKVAVSVKNPNIRFMLGKNYISNTDPSIWRKQHIIFADFSLNENNSKKFMYCYINLDAKTLEQEPSPMYNERFNETGSSFNGKLCEYGIPYDIISRTDNAINRLASAICNIDMYEIRDLLSNESVISIIKSNPQYLSNYTQINEIINTTLFSYKSSDLIDLIYNSGFTLYDMIGNGCSSIISNITNILYSCREMALRNFPVPSESMRKDMENGDIGTQSVAKYIGYFSVFETIMKNETDADFIDNILINNNVERQTRNGIYDTMVMSLIGKDVSHNALRMLSRYCYRNNFKDGINKIINEYKNDSSYLTIITSVATKYGFSVPKFANFCESNTF